MSGAAPAPARPTPAPGLPARASRLLLFAGGVLLAVSLFLPWFDGVSGWEHWAWADGALAVLGAEMVLVAMTTTGAVRRGLVAAFAGLGIAVVIGHGFEPDEATSLEDLGRVHAGGYVALAGLALGAIGALATWPRRGGAVLLVAGAAGLVVALLSGWGSDTQYVAIGTVSGASDGTDYPNGFERWRVLDVGLLVLAAGLLASLTGRVPRAARAVLGIAALAAAACVLVGGRDQLWADEGAALGAATGTIAALLALAAGVAGLALVRPRERAPAARAG